MFCIYTGNSHIKRYKAFKNLAWDKELVQKEWLRSQNSKKYATYHDFIMNVVTFIIFFKK